jgi:2-phosphosulfolactate phosphatase
MHVHVALGPAEFGAAGLEGRAALVIDVLRATTSVVAACVAGCRSVIPVPDESGARRVAGRFPAGECLLAGERGGDPIPGFDLGNSPLEFTRERVGGRVIVLTTTNGTGAMLAAAPAAAVGVAALTNVSAAARWGLERGADLTLLCAGEKGGFCLEDAVCAGFVVEALASDGARGLRFSDAAMAARRMAGAYAGRLERLIEDAAWARHLHKAGRAADFEACLALSTSDQVPVRAGGAIVPGPAARAAAADLRR